MTHVIVTTPNELESLIQTSVRKALSEQGGGQNQQQEQDKLFSVQEAAVFLNLAKQTLYSFTYRRLIPFIKRGKKLYFRKSELEQWLAEGKRKTVVEIHASI